MHSCSAREKKYENNFKANSIVVNVKLKLLGSRKEYPTECWPTRMQEFTKKSIILCYYRSRRNNYDNGLIPETIILMRKRIYQKKRNSLLCLIWFGIQVLLSLKRLLVQYCLTFCSSIIDVT